MNARMLYDNTYAVPMQAGYASEPYVSPLEQRRVYELQAAENRRALDILKRRLKINNPAAAQNRLGMASITPVLLLLAAGIGAGAAVGGSTKGLKGAAIGGAIGAGAGLGTGLLGTLIGSVRGSMENVSPEQIREGMKTSLSDYLIPGKAARRQAWLSNYIEENIQRPKQPVQILH